jgi:hypothetical protein
MKSKLLGCEAPLIPLRVARCATRYSVALMMLASLALAFQAEAEDQVVARTGRFLVILHTDKEDTGTMRLVKVETNGKNIIIASDEDIEPIIEKLLRRKDAYELISQMVDSQIKSDGGVKKYQKGVDKDTKEFGKDYYNNITPMAIEAFKARGVIIPYTPKVNGSSRAN